MSWQDYSVIQLRHAINDVDEPVRYADNRLQLAWLVGASYVVNEFTLQSNYVVDLLEMSIVPDPTGSSLGTDQWATNLITLRSAIIMVGNDLKLSTNSAWSIRDVHMSVDMKELYKANKIILDEVKEQYEFIRMQYCLGVQPSVQAILTPINIISAGYRPAMYGYAERDRMIY